ncbi:phosphonoacetaldehyde hydrolase [Vreelandella rituensis]|uniref:Phosphonoacetaldehyde hydrolase n=1 Tax=Vreelandella rituensis TaxID=2282306 RepID=A0A368TNZ0_9GAMM|nr:phosphonoacetaldehyde hydrolase [Halomonas rituensis]RCV85982.1 phosphonoacetaldehyde hydrolase [Halomonas rituensis]
MIYQTPSQLDAVIFDWAGTLVDFGSFAPTQIFVEAFAEMGIALSLEEARGPMGMGKWDHIRTLCNDRDIAARFEIATGHLPTDDDVTALYERFLPLQIEKIADHSAPIPGALDVVATLRKKGMKLGSCSGYPAVVMENVVALAREQGLVLDYVIATDEVPNGRPYPAQSLANVMALSVRDVAACVKVDDTVPGIVEGRSAGMWTVALTCSGNALGVTFETYQSMEEADRQTTHRRIAEQFASSQPHYLIETIAELPGVISAINARLVLGERP